MFNYMGYYYTSEKINVLDLMPFFIKKEKKSTNMKTFIQGSEA